MLFLNVFLAMAWTAATGVLTLPNLIIGFAIGFVALWVTRFLYGGTRYFEKMLQTVDLFRYFLYELVKSNLEVMWDVLTPELKAQPGIVAVPLDAETDVEIMLLANMISLTPGTLSLDVSPDRKTLYVHAMYIDDPDETRAALKEGMERNLLEALR